MKLLLITSALYVKVPMMMVIENHSAHGENVKKYVINTLAQY